MFKEIEARLKDQHFIVREYFTKIGHEDPYKLDIRGFFNRVCSSIVNNGLEKTCEIYSLDLNIIKEVETGESNDTFER